MFWSQAKNESETHIGEPVESLGHHLREELRLRLRVAADFATLGAYDLSDPEDAEERPAPAVAEAVRQDPPQRVFLFAKVAPVCPHSAAPERACTGREGVHRRERQRHTAQRQRGGAVRAPDQPCLCASARVPAA
jgi:hypothetical protein